MVGATDFYIHNKLLHVVSFLLGDLLASEVQMLANHPGESTQHSEHGKRLKSRKILHVSTH
jgi:hypothetical protein